MMPRIFTMMFRKLYWVVETLLPNGASSIHGVYTSIPNLLKYGIDAQADLHGIRLSLTRLDSDFGVIAAWSGESFSCFGDDLVQFVETDDFSEDQRQALVNRVHERLSVRSRR